MEKSVSCVRENLESENLVDSNLYSVEDIILRDSFVSTKREKTSS